MAFAQWDWGKFSAAAKAKDAEVADAIANDFFNPPDGTYECLVIGKSAAAVLDAKTGETIFGFYLTYLILEHPQYANREFRSQFYRFNEQGLPWTKGFVASLHPDGRVPNGSEELLETINTAVAEQYAVNLEVTTRTYTGKDGNQASASRERILSSGGSTRNGSEQDGPAPTDIE